MSTNTHNILILHSQDGPNWTHAVMYPADWQPSQADDAAVEAFKAAQVANPDEWSWDDIETELTERGFILTCWHQGPTWDEDRILPSAVAA